MPQMEIIKRKINTIDSIVENIKDMAFADLVSWHDLKKWEIGESRLIGGTNNTKIVDEPNIMIFETVFPVGKIFPKHWHDCHEDIFVVDGLYADEKERFVRPGESIAYEKGLAHVPRNAGNCPLKILVTFTFSNGKV